MKTQTQFSIVAAILVALSTTRGADAEADSAWAKVDAAIEGIKKPTAQPKSREEAMEMFKNGITALDAVGKEFLDKYPNDARRWKLHLFEAMTAQPRGVVGLPLKGDAKALLGDILKSADADAETKSEASAVNVLMSSEGIDDGKVSAEDWTKSAEAHLKAYPDNKLNKAIQGRMTSMKALADIMSKPLDLKFTAVDGHEVDLSKMNGKVVLVDFWATWCGPCVAELPNVLKAYEKLHPKGFEIIGISLDSDKEKLENFTKEKGMTWVQYFDGKGWQNEISSKFGINSIPAMWLVNKKGIVVSTNARGKLEELVGKYLAE